MKVINRKIDVVAWFQSDGYIRPLKFKVQEDDESELVIKVDRVIIKDVQKVGGILIHTFICQSIINDSEKVYEIRYDTRQLKWTLFKI